MGLDIDTVATSARAASDRISELIRETPLVLSEALSAEAGCEVYLKLENRQITGSFKLRGASNRLLTLSEAERRRGAVAASSGNHGAAVACALQKLGEQAIIFVPEQTSSAKVDAIRRYGGDVRYFGTDGLDTEQHARQYAAEQDMLYLSPYNDAEVIAGQGSCGVEILQQLPDVDCAYIAVGGGGLMGGVGSVLKHHNPNVRLVACQPAASAVMAHSVDAGRILDLESGPTLSDGTAGGIEADAITFELCRQLCDEFVLVSEAEIAAAMRLYQRSEGEAIEGAAGVAIAALMSSTRPAAGQKVVVIICGGNVSDATLASIQVEGDA
ncbi:MAG: threonine/serine dehydratase [Gammaproteobacteria bacterium]|nr:threonine/serine dehydratase [Gammaproteobacteria bacterium]